MNSPNFYNSEHDSLILKSKKLRTSLVAFGNVVDDNNNPVAVVLNLQPEGKNLKVNDIQEVVSAYAKTYNPLEFLRTGDVIYLNRKRVNRLFYRMEIDIPITASLNGSVGKITYKFDNVKIDGKPYNKAFEENNNSNKSIRHPLSEDSTGKPLTEGQKKYF